jgi:uncharacterized coiled-coil protein SlyX
VKRKTLAQRIAELELRMDERDELLLAINEVRRRKMLVVEQDQRVDIIGARIALGIEKRSGPR